MALFLLKTNGGRVQAVVRGKCLTCARNIAANEAGAEGPAVWLDSGRSTIELLRPDDRPGMLLRVTTDEQES